MVKVGVSQLIGWIRPGTRQTLSGALAQTVETDLLSAPCAVEEEVGRNAMKPTLERPRLKSMQRAEYPYKDVLSEIFGVVRIPCQPICQPIDPSAVVAYQLFPSRGRPDSSGSGCDARGCRRLPSLRIRGGPLRHRFDLPTTSGDARQVQPERLIVARHPGNALNEPWQLPVRDRVLPHNCPTGRALDTFRGTHCAPHSRGPKSGPQSVSRNDLPRRQAGCSQGGSQALYLGRGGLDQGRPQAADVTALQPQASFHQDAALGCKDPGVDR